MPIRTQPPTSSARRPKMSACASPFPASRPRAVMTAQTTPIRVDRPPYVYVEERKGKPHGQGVDAGRHREDEQLAAFGWDQPNSFPRLRNRRRRPGSCCRRSMPAARRRSSDPTIRSNRGITGSPSRCWRWIGGNVIRGGGDTMPKTGKAVRLIPAKGRKLLVLAVATSIDALAVGLCFSLLNINGAPGGRPP